MQQYIAYKGLAFTIEWYYDAKGQAPALEHFKKQPKDKQRKLLIPKQLQKLGFPKESP
jgi:hypothetical protein